VCYTRIQDLLGDLTANAVPLAEPLATRIHIAQTVDGKYRKALEMMLGARVGLGRAIRRPWTVLDRELREMPPDGVLTFSPGKGEISVAADGRVVPLLKAPRLADGEADYLARIIADPETQRRVSRFAPSLAEGLLAVEVEPQPNWQCWRDAMRAVVDELLFTVALFGYEASPMPEYAPAREKRGEEMEQRLNSQTPRNKPELDLQWEDPGEWTGFVGPDPIRSTDASP